MLLRRRRDGKSSSSEDGKSCVTAAERIQQDLGTKISNPVSIRMNFFSLSNSLYESFLGHSMNIFRVNLRAWIFFHLIFPCANIFLYLARTPPPTPPPSISFLMVHPLPWAAWVNYNMASRTSEDGQHATRGVHSCYAPVNWNHCPPTPGA